MNKKSSRSDFVNNKQRNCRNELYPASKIFIFTIVVSALLLLLLSLRNLPVFAKGEFVYLESIGTIFAYLTFYYLSLLIFFKMFHKIRINNRFLRFAVYVGSVGVGIFLTLLITTFVWIRHDVISHCEDAKKEYGGNCIEALTNQLEDKNCGFASRNAAVWALGQLANKNSLPVLKKYYTGIIPNKESLNKTISQYELEKAIRWCQKGNITSWMYK